MDSEQDIIDTVEADPDGSEPIGLPATAGAMLRAAREGRRLSLDHVAAETRIPIRHLETIEEGDFDALPSRTYAIGFARNYARAVDLDEATIAELVREEMGNGGPRYSSVGQGMEPGDPAKLPSKGLAWFAGIAALLLALGVASFASSYFGSGTGPGSLLSVGEASEETPAQAEAGEGAQTPASALTAAPSVEDEVIFTATGEGAWVRFYEEEGERLFEGVMQDGDTFAVPVDAEDPWINTGRPNLFTITIGGQNVPPLSEEMVALQAPVSAAALLDREPG